MQRGGVKPQGTLQRFQQSNVLGDIIVLVSDHLAILIVPSAGPSITLQYQMGPDSRVSRRRCKPRGPALCGELVPTMPDVSSGVKILT